MLRAVRFLFFILIFGASLSFGAQEDYQVTETDLIARKNVQASIRPLCAQPNILAKTLFATFSAVLRSLYPITPARALNFIDQLGSYTLKYMLRFDGMRANLIRFAFANDNRSFGCYDASFGVYRELPFAPVAASHLSKLIDTAYQEREHWQNGKMSGGIYDGSTNHMATLAKGFQAAYGNDPHNREILQPEGSLELASTAYEAFHTSNPLHGTSFPLSVKAMRELGLMLAHLLGAEHGLVNSGAREALRLGLRALKLASTKPPASQRLALVVDDQHGLIESVGATLNLKSLEATSTQLIEEAAPSEVGVDFMVLHLSAGNETLFNRLCTFAEERGLPLHVHMSNEILRRWLQNKTPFQSRHIFQLSPAIRSVSFDTAGLVFAGISATLFANAHSRFEALESYVHWLGGIYPGLNTAGSIAGGDYIIAYLLLLHNGYVGLLDLAKQYRNHPTADHKEQHSARSLNHLSQKIAVAFNSPTPSPQLGLLRELRQELQTSMQRADPSLAGRQRYEWEQLLVDLTLSLFEASAKDFVGRITSGGTESIRLAIQHYAHRFRQKYQGKQPIFLMTDMAHIAFDRHMLDTDSRVLRVASDERQGMNLDDLKAKIADLGSENIAAIIAATPSYPLGIADNIAEIAHIAKIQGIPLHVDACLGGFVMQFIDDNPFRLRLQEPQWEGVSSWSADLHKYGVTHKGLSFVGLRKSWLAGASDLPASIASPRSQGSLEVGLSCLLSIGKRGYQERASKIVSLGRDLVQALEAIATIEVVGKPVDARVPHWVVAFRLKAPLQQHSYSLAKMMSQLGWGVSQVGNYTLHIALTSAHTYNPSFVMKFVSDLRFATSLIVDNPHMRQSSSVGVYGMAAELPQLALGRETTSTWLSSLLKLYGENIVGGRL